MAKLVRIENLSSPSSETYVIERLQRWRDALGSPIGVARDNPDNDLWYLLLDAETTIDGLRRYARNLERSLAEKAQ